MSDVDIEKFLGQLRALPTSVQPQQHTFPVRDRSVTLTAMGGAAQGGNQQADWVGLRICAANRQVRILRELGGFASLALNETDDQDEKAFALAVELGQIWFALLRMALGLEVPADWINALSEGEKMEIISAQDTLNGMHVLEILRPKDPPRRLPHYPHLNLPDVHLSPFAAPFGPEDAPAQKT